MNREQAQVSVEFLRGLEDLRQRCVTPYLLAKWDSIGEKSIKDGKTITRFTGKYWGRLALLRREVEQHEQSKSAD